jgi:hypothetical protein
MRTDRYDEAKRYFMQCCCMHLKWIFYKWDEINYDKFIKSSGTENQSVSLIYREHIPKYAENSPQSNWLAFNGHFNHNIKGLKGNTIHTTAFFFLQDFTSFTCMFIQIRRVHHISTRKLYKKDHSMISREKGI